MSYFILPKDNTTCKQWKADTRPQQCWYENVCKPHTYLAF